MPTQSQAEDHPPQPRDSDRTAPDPWVLLPSMPAVELPQLEPTPVIAPRAADHSTHPHPPPLPQEVAPGSLWAAVQQLHVHVKGNKA